MEISVFFIFLLATILLGYFLCVEIKNKQSLYEEQQKAKEETYNLMLKQQTDLKECRFQERKRISADLHDAILGRLYGVRLGFEFLDIQASDRDYTKFCSLVSELQEIEKEIREISHDLLSKKVISNWSFVNLLENLVSKKNDLGVTDFSLQHDEEIEWENVQEELRVDIFRTIEEAIHNSLKHSESQKVLIKIRKRNNGVLLEIIDDGKGFEVSEECGVGLTNIASRTRNWGGDVKIFSEPEKGTKVSAFFPLQNEKDESRLKSTYN